MDGIQEAVERLKNLTSGTKYTQTYECEKCRDTEWIYMPDKNGVYPCECREVKAYKRMIENSGLTEAFKAKTFESFIPRTPALKNARRQAALYCKSIMDGGNGSIALLGQVGCGKTHLSWAIGNKLIESKIGVLYMQYREAITRLKQIITDDESYIKEINKYKNAKVLMIDDAFKGAIKDGKANDSDIRIMFEIINYRYITKKPIILSSEYLIDDMLNFDEAVGSRIFEMCKGYLIKFTDTNYRLNSTETSEDSLWRV